LRPGSCFGGGVFANRRRFFGRGAANIAGMRDVIAQPFAKREVEITARRR